MCISYISYVVLTYRFNFKMTVQVIFKIISMMLIAWFVCAGFIASFNLFLLEGKMLKIIYLGLGLLKLWSEYEIYEGNVEYKDNGILGLWNEKYVHMYIGLGIG